MVILIDINYMLLCNNIVVINYIFICFEVKTVHLENSSSTTKTTLIKHILLPV